MTLIIWECIEHCDGDRCVFRVEVDLDKHHVGAEDSIEIPYICPLGVGGAVTWKQIKQEG